MNMRIRSVAVGMALLTTVVTACSAPAPPVAPAGQAAGAAAGPPTGDLAQLMRGILFPNSNVIFDAQSNDPGAPKKEVAGGGGGGASAQFANVYAGWPMVEGAAVALAEATDLILKPGRLCSNGKPAPVERDDFKKFAQGLREAGIATLAAAKEKSQDKVIEVTDKVADACANCHEVYRDKGPAGSPERCTP
jgi:cytochrome c556